jgi:antitoxin component of MazEF toxin-antitoxin module
MVKQLSRVGNSVALILDRRMLKHLNVGPGADVLITLGRSGSLSIRPFHHRRTKSRGRVLTLTTIEKFPRPACLTRRVRRRSATHTTDSESPRTS